MGCNPWLIPADRLPTGGLGGGEETVATPLNRHCLHIFLFKHACTDFSAYINHYLKDSFAREQFEALGLS